MDTNLPGWWINLMISHIGEILYQSGALQIIDCSECGFAHLNPIPSEEEIRDFYKNKYYDRVRQGTEGKNLKRLLDREEEELSWLYNTSYQDIQDYLNTHLKNKSSICDIGCGSGTLLEYLARTEPSWTCIGIDPSNNSGEKDNIIFFNCEIEGFLTEHPEYHNTVDVVLLIGVLEHSRDPAGLLSIARSLLKDGGNLIISVPNDFSILQDAARNELQTDPWWVVIPTHINYFNFDSLVYLISKMGFQPKIGRASCRERV
jgi:2-polyprenyl-3-methyl-5-hydroxy-6-metoxy-1,4-benzoquinol methylase